MHLVNSVQFVELYLVKKDSGQPNNTKSSDGYAVSGLVTDQPIPRPLMATLWEQVVVGLVVPEASDGCSDGRSGGRGKLYLSSFPLSGISLKSR